LALRWICDAARAKGGPMKRSLADILVDSFNNTGEVVRKKDEVHRMAQANRAFAHLG
jgi:small subunit ribosomal protein S7